jgi:uncharacterized membrane protein YraQ (UPF0718 family)
MLHPGRRNLRAQALNDGKIVERFKVSGEQRDKPRRGHRTEQTLLQNLQNGLMGRDTGRWPRASSVGFFGVVAILALTLAVLAGLFVYKWGSAFRAVAGVQSTGAYPARPELIATAGLPLLVASGARTVNYLAVIWPALLFGVLIAGLVQAFLSPRNVARLLGSGAVRQQLIGGVVGMPLMLCSCCITPVFSSAYAGGARLGSALAILLSSPSLNVGALLLTFLLFPRDMAVARAAMAVFAVFVLPVLIERLAGGEVSPGILAATAGPADGVLPRHPLDIIRAWGVCSGNVAWKTLPLIILGVYASGLLVGWFDRPSSLGVPSALVIAGVAFLAALIALPTFFEIPFALLLLANGFPPGAALAMLFAGPAVNLPSLFTLARVSSRRIAVLTFLGVWATAAAGGLLLEVWRR